MNALASMGKALGRALRWLGVAAAAGVASPAALAQGAPGLVAAYRFDAGAGLIATDETGNGHHATLDGAHWSAAGISGGALSFDGINDLVTIGDAAALDLSAAMTLEAWVQPTALGSWRTVILRETGNDLAYALYASDSGGRPAGYLRNQGGYGAVNAGGGITTGEWTHLALSYDGVAMRVSVNATEVASQPVNGAITTSAGSLRIGGNAVWGEYFAGLIDEVRVYKRALSAAEIAADMQDLAPSAPALRIDTPAAGATVSGPDVAISYSVAGDLSEVSHVHFQLDDGPQRMDPPPIDGSYTLGDVSPGVHTVNAFLVRADHSAIAGTESSVTFSVAAADVAPPTVSLSAPAAQASVSGVVTIAATASDDVAVAEVQFTVNGANLGTADTSAPYTVSWDTAASAVGTHTLGAVATDTSGRQASATPVEVSVVGAADPALVGAWEPPVSLPTVAVNLILLHTGKVMFWAGDFATSPNFGELWDPATNAITPVPNPFSNIFCSAHVQLADGRLLVAGGHDRDNGILGLATSNIFDPVTETWSELPNMAHRRWYPTLTMLGDGRAIINSGSEFNEDEFVATPEVFDPVTNSWTEQPDIQAAFPQYPMMFLLPDGRLIETGSTEDPTANQVLDFDLRQWEIFDPRVLEGGSAAMYAPGKILKSGSPTLDGLFPLDAATDLTYVIDTDEIGAQWREVEPMAYPRTFHNITNLPDGTVIATGGSERRSERNLAPAVLHPEIWSPGSETWSTMAPMQFERLYHGTAVLLPDGRVAVAGGGNLAGATDMLSVEIYSPPYLFKGPRPVVEAAPEQAEYGADFLVTTADAARIASVALMRPGAATHGFDQDQRYVPLDFQVDDGNTLRVQAPGDGNLAPPGYYMLFIVDADGVPSVAPFVRLRAPYENGSAPDVSMLSPRDGDTLTGRVLLQVDASDANGIAGVQYLLDGAAIGAEVTVAPYSLAWDSAGTANGVHSLSAVARSATGGRATAAAVSVTLDNGAVKPPGGLVAAWSFEAGAGNTAVDLSGNGHAASLDGASWTAQGRVGGALSFDGVNDSVGIADADALDLGDSLTLEAWVYPTALGGYRTVVLKETASDLGYALYAASGPSPGSSGWARSNGVTSVGGPAVLPLETWTHVALTYDGAALMLYENGVVVNTRQLSGPLEASDAPLRIGGNTIWGEYFAGRIDEVRIYDRALSAAEIVADMNSVPVTGPRLIIDAPASGALVQGDTVDVSYALIGDLSEVSHVHFRLDGGPDRMDPPPVDGVFELTGVSPGQHVLDGYLVRAGHGKIDGSDAASVAFNTTVPDTTAPTVVLVEPRDGDTLQGAVSVDALASDNLGVVGVQLLLSGQPVGPEIVTAPFDTTWNTATVANGTYVLSALARDAAGNTSESIGIVVTIANPQTTPGLVASYGFDEGAGSVAGDASGNGNDGALAGATWSAAGRFGGALSFDGSNDSVTVADADVLDLDAGMTLSAWVNPTALGGWDTVMLKEAPGDLAYALYANDNAPRAAGYVNTAAGTFATVPGAAALPLNQWTHLAITYDGAVLRYFRGGAEIASRAVSGGLVSTGGALSIGGNSVWGEYFAGSIDEVRVYDRALSAGEIEVDLGRPVVPETGPRPTRSSPIIVDPVTRFAWVVNPDNDSVTAMDADSLDVLFEAPVCAHPASLALDGYGMLWLVCRDDDSAWVLDAQTGALVSTLKFDHGAAPVSIVFDPAGETGYIASHGHGRLLRVDALAQEIEDSLAVGPSPRALAVSGDGTRLLVSQFISGDDGGRVRSVDLDSFMLADEIVLPLDTTTIDSPIAARGLPNYVGGLAIDPDGGSAWLVAKKDNTLRGSLRDGNALTFETSVRALVGLLDLGDASELVGRRIDIDNHAQPSAVALSDSGEQLLVTMQGNNRVVVLNPLGGEIARAATGLAPQGVVIDPATGRVWTKNLISRDVSVFDASDLLAKGSGDLVPLATVSTVAVEQLEAQVLRGKQLFYDASDPRMGTDGYLSCALCHLDGGHDGRSWDFTQRGEGLRNTISLRGQGGDTAGPLHWTGNFDEVQDFENDIRGEFGGAGLMADIDFLAGSRAEPLGDEKGGLSVDLDALAAYVNSLASAPRSPHRGADGGMSAQAEAGALLFDSLGCDSSHLGERFSDSALGVRHDVGTLRASSGQRLGAPLDGLDTPMLPGLWDTAPYLHDGSAATLRDVLVEANPDSAHGDASSLAQQELDELVDYLLQLEFD